MIRTDNLRQKWSTRLWVSLDAAMIPAFGLGLSLLLIAGLISFISVLETERLQNSRAAVILVDLQERLETDLGLGFALPESASIQPLLEKTIALDADIYAIEVMDERGLSLFNTDRGAIGEYAPQAWLRRIGAGNNASAGNSGGAGQTTGWSLSTAAETTLAMPIRGSFDEVQGYVAISYAQDSRPDGSGFTWYAAGFVALMIALAAILCIRLERRRLIETMALFRQRSGTATAAAPHVIVNRTRARLDAALADLDNGKSMEEQ